MDQPAAPRRRWRGWKWVRRGAVAGALTTGVLLVGLGVGWLWLRSEPGNAWLGRKIEGVVQGLMLEGTVSVGALHTDLWSRVAVDDFALVAADGRTVVGADALAVQISLLPLLAKQAKVRSATVDGLVVDLDLGADGVDDFTRMFGASEGPSEPWQGLPVDLAVARAEITRGSVRIARGAQTLVSVGDVTVGATVRSAGKDLAVSDVTLRARLRAPGEGDVGVTGGVVYDGASVTLDRVFVEAFGSRLGVEGVVSGLDADVPVVAARIGAEPLDLGGLSPLTGDIGLQGRFRGALAAEGPLSALRVTGALDDRDGAGGLTVDAVVDATATDLVWTGSLVARQLRVDGIAPRQTRGKIPNQEPQLVIDGTLAFEGSGTKFPDGLAVTGRFTGTSQDIYGIDLTALDAGLSLDQGVLRIAEAHPVGPIADAVISGTLDLAHGPAELTVVGGFDPAELARFGAEQLTGRGRVDVRVVGDLLATDPVWRVGGTVTIDDFARGEEVRFDRIDADVRVAAGATTRVTGSVTGTGGATYGVAIGAIEEPALDVLVGADGAVTIQGVGGATDVVQEGAFAVADAEGPWEVRVDPTGRVVVRADLILGSTEVSVLSGDAGRARVVVDPESVGFEVALSDGERVVVDTTGRFLLGPAEVALATLDLSPVPGRRFSAERPVRLRLTDGGIADADIALVSADGAQHVEITGQLGTTGPLDGRVAVSGLDLGLVAELFPEQAGDIDAVLDLTADVGGDASAFRLDGRVAASGRFLDGVDQPLSVSGTFASTPTGDLGVDLRLATEGQRVGRVRGTVPLVADLAAVGLDSGGRVDVTLDVVPGPVSRFGALYTMEWPDVSLSASVRATGTMQDPDLAITGLIETALDGWSQPARVEVAVLRRGAELSLWGDLLEGWTRRGTLDGGGATRVGEWFASLLGDAPEPDTSDYSLFLDDMDLGVNLLALPWQSLAALGGVEASIDGRVAGTVKARGSANAPELSASLAWAESRLGGVTMTNGALRIEPGDDELVVDARGAFEQDGSLFVAGAIPFDLDLRRDASTWFPADMAVQVGGAGLPLAALSAFDRQIVDASGLAVVTGTVGGRPTDPDPDVRMTVDGGALDYLGTGARYEDIAVSARATRAGVEIERFAVRTRPIGSALRPFDALELGDGLPSLEFTGGVALDAWSPGAVTGAATFRRTVVMWLPDFKTRVTGDLTFSGEWPAVAVRGGLRVDEAAIDRDEASFFEAGPLTVDDAIRIHRGTAPVLVAAPEEEPGVVDFFDIDVAVDLSRNVEILVAFPFLDDLGELGASITRADVSARLGGEVRFLMRGGTPQLYGDVDVVEGQVRVIRSLFDMDSGSVVFTGPATNPNIDLAATMTDGDVTVNLSIGGTAEAPLMVLSSPDYADTSQILTFLVTGQAPDTLSSGQGQAALQAALGLLTQSVFSGAQIANFSIDPDGKIRFGVPVGRNLVADVVFAPNRRLGENQIALDGELQLARRLVVDFTAGDVQSDVNLLFELRF